MAPLVKSLKEKEGERSAFITDDLDAFDFTCDGPQADSFQGLAVYEDVCAKSLIATTMTDTVRMYHCKTGSESSAVGLFDQLMVCVGLSLEPGFSLKVMVHVGLGRTV